MSLWKPEHIQEPFSKKLHPEIIEIIYAAFGKGNKTKRIEICEKKN